MEMKMSAGVAGAEMEIKNANYTNIRYLEISKTPSSVPQANIVTNATWKICNTQNLPEYSAVAYFFAKKIYEETSIPIGIINSTWGGSRIEAWMSDEVLAGLPHQAGKDAVEVESSQHTLAQLQQLNGQNIQQLLQIVDSSFLGIEEGVTQLTYDDSAWQETQLDEFISKKNGVFWLRKKFIIEELPNEPVILKLGIAGNYLVPFINNKRLASVRNEPIEIEISEEYLVQGENVLVFRLANPWWPPYILKDKGVNFMKTSDGNFEVSGINSGWKFNAQIEPELPKIYTLQEVPSALFNGMINPLFQTSIAGVLWYQGENNGDQGSEYSALFTAMIQDWRIRFKQGYFPFLFVQLANWGTPTLEVEKKGWPYLREAQDMALKLPATAMATIIDVGDQYDIHPTDKKTVGERLALAALNLKYNKEVIFSRSSIALSRN